MALTKFFSQNDNMTGPSATASVTLSLYTIVGPNPYVTNGFDADITAADMGAHVLANCKINVAAAGASDTYAPYYDTSTKKIKVNQSG